MNTSKTETQLIDLFVNGKDVVTGSRRAYKIALHQWFRYLVIQGRPSRKPIDRDVFRWKEKLLETKSIWTVNAYLGTLKQFYKWLESEKIYENICRNLKPLKLPKGFRKKPLTQIELKNLLTLRNDSHKEYRDYLLTKAGYLLGLRMVELSRLSKSDIVSNPPGLMILGKGQQVKEVVYISIDLLTELIQLSESTPKDTTALFQSYHRAADFKHQRLSPKECGRIITDRMKLTGCDMDGKSPHSLRHSAAFDVLKQTKDIFRCQLFMRHSTPTTTRLYLQHGEQSYLKQTEIEKILMDNLK